MTLLEATRSLAPAERSMLDMIRVDVGDGGYKATFSINMRLPHADNLDLPAGVELLGFVRTPDIIRILDWRIDPWEQMLELIHDPELSMAGVLGMMEACEGVQRSAFSGWEESLYETSPLVRSHRSRINPRPRALRRGWAPPRCCSHQPKRRAQRWPPAVR